MVGQVSSKVDSFILDKPRVNLRETIVLTFGLSKKSITKEQSFTFIKNLEFRINSMLGYRIPKDDSYRLLINKLLKEGVLYEKYSPTIQGYLISLTEFGEGEFDYILHSVANDELMRKFVDFQSLIDLFW